MKVILYKMHFSARSAERKCSIFMILRDGDAWIHRIRAGYIYTPLGYSVSSRLPLQYSVSWSDTVYVSRCLPLGYVVSERIPFGYDVSGRMPLAYGLSRFVSERGTYVPRSDTVYPSVSLSDTVTRNERNGRENGTTRERVAGKRHESGKVVDWWAHGHVEASEFSGRRRER